MAGENPDAFERIADNGYCPCWTPDGSCIVFGGFAPSWNIFKVNLNDKKIVQLTFDRGYHPAVSPGGRFVTYDSRGAMGILKMISLSNGKQVDLADRIITGNFSSWSPDGKTIVFNRAGALWTFNRAIGKEIKIYTSGNNDSRAVWSPDGTRIAFDSGFPRQDGNVDIFVMNSDGTNLKQLTDHPKIDSQPSWSPDGRWLAYMSQQSGNRDIWIMSADGTQKTRLTIDPEIDVWPRWSPDGKKIAFGSQRQTKSKKQTNIWIIQLEKQLEKDFLN
jgi:TolB protein